MKRIKLWHLGIISLTAVLLQNSNALGEPQNSTASSEIIAENQKWADAWKRGDVKAVAGLYTDDARLLPPGEDIVIGREAVFNFLKKERDASWPDVITFKNFEVYGDDKVATEVSEVEIHDKNGVLKGRAKQILIFLKQGGKWKLHRDTWTSSAPVQP